MPIEHIPAHGIGEDDIPYIIRPGALPDHAEVPLVVYINGDRKEIGTAVVNLGKVTVTLGDEVGEEVKNLIYGRPEACMFSLGFDPGPNPYPVPTPRQKSINYEAAITAMEEYKTRKEKGNDG